MAGVQGVQGVQRNPGGDGHGHVGNVPPQPSEEELRRQATTFLNMNRPDLIKDVSEVMPIADQLFSQGFIGQETYDNIEAATPSQKQMRCLFKGLNSAQGKLAFCKILQKEDPYLWEELQTAR